MKILFSKKIECAHCGGNFKGKKENKNRVYICSLYDNFGKCKREVVHQDFLLELLERRFNRKLSAEEINEVVEKIIFENKDKFTIYLKKGIPIIFGDNFVQF